jgi:RNA polymerase sigma factor (sigma-70 family)
MRDDPSVVALVTRARDGEKEAWHEIVERYAPLVWAICCRHRLSRADADDVGGSVWLRLVEHLASLRDPAALPGWVATTTQRECLRVRRAGERYQRLEDAVDADTADGSALVEHEVLIEERNFALRTAFAQLPEQCRQLLALLIQDPPVPYSEISRQLATPIGSIGPHRSRCLARLRQNPLLTAVLNSETTVPAPPRTTRANPERSPDPANGGETHGDTAVER